MQEFAENRPFFQFFAVRWICSSVRQGETEMYKNLNAKSLGITARQNELIELALTYKFEGFDIDIVPLAQQAVERGQDHATRFISSANIQIGSFELPVDLAAPAEDFEKELAGLSSVIDVAAAIGAKTSLLNIRPYCQGRQYHENFELHRERISQVAGILEPHDIRLGLGFLAPKHHREGYGAQFIATPDALLTLIKTIVADNIGLCLDVWAWHVGGGSIDQLRGFPISKVMMVRLADVPLDADLDSITEEDRLLPGSTGVVPIADWISWLREQNYEGPVAPYCHPAQFAGAKRTQSVEQVAEAISRLVDVEEQEDDGTTAAGKETTASASASR
jgi:sugar phosphate isomerase/epimerase